MPRRFGSAGHALVARALVLLAVLLVAQHGLAQDDWLARGTTRLVVFGDFNGPYGSTTYPAPVPRVIDAIVADWRPDAVVFMGDVVAGQSRSLTRDEIDAMWRAFDGVIASRLRQAGIPYFLTAGNHDASSLRSGAGYSFPLDREAARDYWSHAAHRTGIDMRAGSQPPFDSSFVLGDVFIVIVDASSATVTAEQRQWLANELSSDAARAATARLVFGHLPLVPVSVGRDAPGEYVAQGEELADLLVEHCASAYVSGHHAAYYPGVWRDLEILAAGGVGARRLLGSDAEPRSTVTVVDVWSGSGSIRYTTFDAVTLEPIPASQLPEALPTGVVISQRAGAASPVTCPGRDTDAAR